MNVLMVGTGAGGSWQVRGVQLGRAIGACVTSSPTQADVDRADVIVLVKRAIYSAAALVRGSGKLVIWDAVDFWRQAYENSTQITDHVATVKRLQADAGVSLVIGATKAMADAVGGVYLPHHSRPGLTPQAPRTDAKVVAYEGQQKYLGPWCKALETACRALGLTFVVNPPDLREADIVVAVRGGKHDGAVCQEWKSGVKLVNALCAGKPVLSQRSAAFREIQPHGIPVDDPKFLTEQIRYAMSFEARQQAYEVGKARAWEFLLETVASQYQSIIQSVLRRAA